MGRDVESIVRDLVEIAIDLVREEKLEDVEEKAEMAAEDRLLDLLLPPTNTTASNAAGATEVPGTNLIQLPASPWRRRPNRCASSDWQGRAGRKSRRCQERTRETSCGRSSARASWTTGWWSWTCATATSRALSSSSAPEE